MQIVIDIPNAQYELIKKSDCNAISIFVSKECMMYAIKNGTPLPEKHGDLKDMGNLKYVFDLTRNDTIYSGKEIEQAVKSMKTIIPADKEDCEGE